MSRAVIICDSAARREQAAAWALKAPQGTRIEFKAAKRTADQNARMWAMLTDIAGQVEWEGKKRRTKVWKELFMDYLPREMETLPALDGTERRVPLGRSTSDLSKSEMSDLMTLIEKFGAENGVVFRDANS